MIRIAVVFGTRPEAIKLAPVIEALRNRSREFEVFVCVTAQHREMLDQVLSFFEIKPDYDLNLMQSGQTLNQLSARLIKGLNEVLLDVQPDLVCVQGDTTTTMIGALVAFHLGIKVVHVEAGLRSGRKDSPFPEEVNRILTGHIADFHFAPTITAETNLHREGISDNIWVTGNTAIDALNLGLKKLQNDQSKMLADLDFIDNQKRLILVTGHRRESFGRPFQRIVDAIRQVAERFPDVQIAFPVHLNPQVRELVYDQLSAVPNIHLTGPVDYPTLIWLLRASYLVLTDSGGIQEEAPTLGKPVLVMREVTERMEGIAAGTAELVGSDTDKIVAAVSRLLSDDSEYQKMARAVNPYGDGHAADMIADILSAEVNFD